MANNLHVTEIIPAYALACLEADEANLVAEHLAICGLCRAELQGYQEVAGQMAYALPQAEPPQALRAALLERLPAVSGKPGATDRRASWWQRNVWPAVQQIVRPAVQQIVRPAVQQFDRPAVQQFDRPAVQLPADRTAGQRGGLPRLAPAWALASLVVILFLGASNVLLWQQMRDLRASQPAPLKVVTLTGSQVAPTASGLIVISRDGRYGTLVVDELPALDEARQYQLWLIQDGQRTSGAVFSVSPDGYGSVWVSSPQPLIDYSSFGITIEPKGGSPGPTGDKVLGGDL